MTDPIARPGDSDPDIAQATDEVVERWRTANPGKEPEADAEDFARMRRGFERVAEGETPADEGETPADEG